MSLAEINDVLARQANAWKSTTPYPEGKNGTAGALELSSADEWNRETAYHVWLMNGFLNAEGGNLYACLPNGRAVKLAEDALLRPVTGRWGFDDSPSGWADIFEIASDPFTFIEPIHFTFDLSRVEDSEEREEFAPTLRALEALNGCPVCWRVPVGGEESARTLQALEGRPVCGHFPASGRNIEREAPSGELLMETGGGVREAPSDALPQEKPPREVGRPRKTDHIIDAYLMIFPHGHAALGRKEVAQRLEATLGMEVKLPTLDKALRIMREEDLIRIL